MASTPLDIPPESLQAAGLPAFFGITDLILIAGTPQRTSFARWLVG